MENYKKIGDSDVGGNTRHQHRNSVPKKVKKLRSFWVNLSISQTKLIFVFLFLDPSLLQMNLRNDFDLMLVYFLQSASSLKSDWVIPRNRIIPDWIIPSEFTSCYIYHIIINEVFSIFLN